MHMHARMHRLAHMYIPQRFVRILAADTIPYLSLKMRIKQEKQIAHEYIYDQLLKKLSWSLRAWLHTNVFADSLFTYHMLAPSVSYTIPAA